MTLKQALQVKLPCGKPLGAATLADVTEFGFLLGSGNAETMEQYQEAIDAIVLLGLHEVQYGRTLH